MNEKNYNEGEKMKEIFWDVNNDRDEWSSSPFRDFCLLCP